MGARLELLAARKAIAEASGLPSSLSVSINLSPETFESPGILDELAGIDPVKATELGEVLLGEKPGREAADEVTVYKAMGHAIEDLVVANMVYRNAVERSVGQTINL